jgi:hypothetical protein
MSTLGPSKAQFGATFVTGMIIKKKHTKTLKTLLSHVKIYNKTHNFPSSDENRTKIE